MNPVLMERLIDIARSVRAAGHGNKEAIYQAACEELQMSRSTLIKKLGSVTPKKPRKKRADAGVTALTRDEAKTISGVLMETIRGTGKRTKSIENTITELRTNGLISAGRMDEQTGEFQPLSADAISRALRKYRLHPEQLRLPTPSVQLASLHPNHVWELDASICVLYYLKNPDKRHRGDTGLRVMPQAEFNKNKPKNLAKVVNDRVWSFELTDHTSGWIYAEYLFGGETTENFTSVLINAMQERGGADVLHGVPSILFTDPGSALVSSTMRNLCKALGVKMIDHKAGNARATGSVEKARDILERDFESGLRFVRVDEIAELNRLVRLWRMNYNSRAVHSRHGMTRTTCWLKITEAQLTKAPGVDICRELAIAAPESRKVTTFLQVPFRGRKYDVSSVPGVCVGDSIMITRNAWREDMAQVVITGEDGFETFHLVDEVINDDYGYAVGAPVIGQEYRSLPETQAQHNRAEVELHMTGTSSDAEAEAFRKAKSLPLGGSFNPYLELETTQHPAYLPKRGQVSDVRGPRIEQAALNHVQAAQTLREKLQSQGLTWQAHHYTWLTTQHPDGVDPDHIDDIARSLIAQARKSVISIVNGN